MMQVSRLQFYGLLAGRVGTEMDSLQATEIMVLKEVSKAIICVCVRVCVCEREFFADFNI